ncbi:MAG: SpoIIE family protein phosphatase, partial [Fibrobacterota bacterium]
MNGWLPFDLASVAIGVGGVAVSVLALVLGRRIQRSKNHLEAVFDHVDPMLVADVDMRVLRVNRAFADLVGMPFAALVGKCLTDTVPQLAATHPLFRACMSERRPLGPMEISWAQEPSRILEVHTFPLQTSKDAAREAVMRLRDVTDLSSARKQLVDRNAALGRLTDALQSELEMAREIQQGLLPRELPHLEGLAFHVRYLPSRPVGGDLYDVVVLDETHLGLFVADVSGHGLPAAFEAALVRMSFLNHASPGASPAKVFEGMNRDLRRSLALGHYVTAFYGVLDLETLELSFCRASHPRPVVLHPDGTRKSLASKGLFLGIVENGAYREETEVLNPGDRICLFTDGYYEAAGVSGKRLGYEAFVTRLAEGRGVDPTEVLARVEEEYPGLVDDGREDDKTFLAVDILSTRPGRPGILHRFPGSRMPRIRDFGSSQAAWDLVEIMKTEMIESGWSARDARKAQLAASELCVNALVHGLGEKPDGKARCTWSINRSEILFAVQDEAG